MVRKIGWIALVALAFAALGCSSSGIEAAKATRDEAIAFKADVDQTIADTEATIAPLPVDDPVRVELQPQLDKAKEASAKVQQVIDGSSAVIDSLEKGVPTPGLMAALGALPYGQYAVIAIPFLLYLERLRKAGVYKDSLTRIVQSWHVVGPVLSEEDKAKVAAIQGGEVSSLVASIKAKEGIPDGPPAAAAVDTR